MEDAKTCIDVIMQCTLDFRNTLLAANLERSRELVPLDEEVFQKVCLYLNLGNLFSTPKDSHLAFVVFAFHCNNVNDFIFAGVGSEICIRSASTRNVFVSSKAGSSVQCNIIGFLDVSQLQRLSQTISEMK